MSAAKIAFGFAVCLLLVYGLLPSNGTGYAPFVLAAVFVVVSAACYLFIRRWSTRVSEVAAQFVLDALPGKLMLIDAELNLGDYDAAEAQKRMDALRKDADTLNFCERIVRRLAIISNMLFAVVYFLGFAFLILLKFRILNTAGFLLWLFGLGIASQIGMSIFIVMVAMRTMKWSNGG
jgi:flagellar biosynthesis component FlhA